MLWKKSVDINFPAVRLSGSRVFMRPPAIGDYEAWIDVRARNEERLRPFEPVWAQSWREEETFHRRLERQSRYWAQGMHCSFLIFKEADSALIGGMNINNICRGAAQYGSLGYWIDSAHEGQGYMAEALALTLKYAFEDLGLHRVNAASLLHNERSRKLLVTAGFRHEGEARKYLEINGEWQDHILYGLCIEDWSIHQDI